MDRHQTLRRSRRLRPGAETKAHRLQKRQGYARTAGPEQGPPRQPGASMN